MTGKWRFIEGAGSLGVVVVVVVAGFGFGVVGDGRGKDGCSRHEERGGRVRGSLACDEVGLEVGVSHDRGGVTDRMN